MDTYDQVKALMKLGCGRPPVDASVYSLLGILTTVNEDIGNIVKDAKGEKDLTRQDFTGIEGDVLSLILGLEEWLRQRYEKEFHGRTLSDEAIDSLYSRMILKRIFDK